MLRNRAIARARALSRHREPARPIVLARVRTGLQDLEFALCSRQRTADASFLCIEVAHVAGGVRRLDVESTRLRVTRKITGALNGKGEYRRLVHQDHRGRAKRDGCRRADSRQSFGPCRAAGFDGRASQAPRPLGHLRRRRESNPAYFRRRKRAVGDPAQAIDVIGARDFLARCRTRFAQCPVSG